MVPDPPLNESLGAGQSGKLIGSGRPGETHRLPLPGNRLAALVTRQFFAASLGSARSALPMGFRCRCPFASNLHNESRGYNRGGVNGRSWFDGIFWSQRRENFSTKLRKFDRLQSIVIKIEELSINLNFLMQSKVQFFDGLAAGKRTGKK